MTAPTLDELRLLFPGLGFAIYAYEPGRNVTFEVYAGGDVHTFKGATLAGCIDAAFAAPERPAPPPEPPAPEEEGFFA